MRKPTRIISLLAVVWLLGAAAGLLACGDGDGETDGPSLVGDATSLLAREDLDDLTEAEQDLVESALRQALGEAGTVRVVSAVDQMDFAFSANGRLVMMRTLESPDAGKPETIRVYLEPPARFCDGEEDPEQIVVQEYTYTADEWRVSASAISPDEVPFGVVLSRLELGAVEDAGFSEEEGRRLRGLTVPFPQPADSEATVTTWIDLEDLLIRRLEVTIPSASASYPYVFVYDVPVEIEVPAEPAAPDCVPAE